MNIWDEAELVNESVKKNNIWNDAELINEPTSTNQNIWDDAELVPTSIKNTGMQTKQSENPITLMGGVKTYDYENYTPAKNEHPIKEGVLQIGRNIARAILPKQTENWFVGSKEDEDFLKKYNNSNVPTFESLRDDYDNGVISKDEYLKGVELRGKLNNLTYDKEYRDVRNENIGKGVVDIGSAAIPVGGGAKLAAKGAQLLKPLVGRRAGQLIARGAIGGAEAGAVHGLGYSLVDEDINPVTQIAGDTLGWGTAGAIGGAGLGIGNRIFRNIKANNLRAARANRPSANTTPVQLNLPEITPSNSLKGNSAIPSTENLVNAENNVIRPSVGKEMKPSKLKSTMLKNGLLPQELQNKTIEYEVLHNPETVARAQEAIGTDANAVHRDLLKKISGQGDYENYVLSADDVVKARELATKLYQEGNNAEAVELTEGIIKAASKTGQALQAYTLWARTTPEGAVTYAQKMLNRYNKSQHKSLKLSDAQMEEIKKLAEKVQQTAEGTRENEVAIGKMQKYIADLTPASWQKKYDTFRYINMLLSSKSRTKDFLLTGLNAIDTAIDETIANGIDKVRTLLPMQKAAFSGLKPAEWFKGLRKGFNEGMEDVALNINTSRSGELGRYGLPKTRSFNYTPLSEIVRSPRGLLQLGENALALGEKGLNYTIQVPDRMYYEARFASSLNDQMAALGVKEPTQAMINQAKKEALEAVYQDDSWVSNLGLGTRNLFNNLTSKTENFLNLPDESLPRVGNFLAPFVTTPANIVNTGLKNTFGAPVGLAKLMNAKGISDIRDAEMLIAKNIKSAIPVGIGMAIGKGSIKSNIGENDYQNDAITGLKPQSIVVGDKAFSLKDYPQWSIPMSIGAGLSKGGFPQAAVNTLNAISDISALKAVGDTIDAFKPSYGDELSASDIANNLFRNQGINILSQNIPLGGALGELRNDIDPYSRELYVPKGDTNEEMIKNTLQYTGNRLQNRIPFASKQLPIKYNNIGKPVMINNIQNPVLRPLSEALDFGVRNYNESDLYNNIQNFKESVADSDYRGKTTVGFDKAKRTIKVNDTNLKLDNKQYSEYSKAFNGIRAYLYRQAIESPEYETMPDEEKIKYLNKIKNSADEAVKIKQFNHNPKRKYHEYTQYILDNYEDFIH